ncbi:MAG: hypothetical protein U0L47_05620 [Paludibacteraceae bacterium]|nr:hypothetical protein [Paludibacteraceae bacterium]
MFEPTATYTPITSSALTSSKSIMTSNHSSSFVVSTSLGSSFSSHSSSTVAPISVRTSDKTIRSFSTSGVYEYVIPKGVGSFVRMHRDNVTLNSYGSGVQPPRRSIAFPGEDYETPPTGELDPDFASPVGDVLLPMLLMVGIYAVVRLWRNRKLLLRSK